MKRIFTFEIGENDNGKTIETYLNREKGFSYSQIKRCRRTENGILLNGFPAFTSNRISCGDILSVTVRDEVSDGIIPTDGNFDIIYEDDDILAVDKPPFMPVHPSKGHPDDSLANIVTGYYLKKGENFVFRCVTRLDRNTSGIVLIAKNAAAHDNLRRQLVNGDVKKTYYALVHGITDENGTVNAPIFRPDEATIKRIVSPEGAFAVTNYKRIKMFDGLSLLEVTPETGRTHQIRVHLSYIGHPLCGDFLYGDENDGFERHMLHAASLEFIHPVSGEKVILKGRKSYDFYE